MDCVKNLRIDLRRDDGTPFHFEREWMPPLLQHDILTLYPGSTIYVEAKSSGDSLLLERIVPFPVKRESTLTFSFRQLDDGKMQLITRNPFPRNLKMKLAMIVLDDPAERLRPTSSCPAIARGSAVELWPNAIFLLIVLRPELHFVDAKGGLKCD